MIKAVFVDTSAWIMLLNGSERQHKEAKELYRQLAGRKLVVTNLVISETYTWLRIKVGFRAAADYLNAMQRKVEIGQLEVVYSDYSLEQDAVLLLQKYRDHDFSYTDAVSFALMNKRSLKSAFAYDNHFITAGFILQASEA
jgi:uncharacterized protein